MIPDEYKISMQDKKSGGDDDGGTGTVTLTRTKTQKPAMYKVLLLNDDYTPMEFVIYVLQRFFSKSAEDATKIMLHVHQNGVGICGVFTYRSSGNKSNPGNGYGTAARPSAAMQQWKKIDRILRS